MTNDPTPRFRRAEGADFAEAAALMNRYYVDLLSPEERQGGYLLATFTGEQLAAMNTACAVFVAHVGGQLAGCLCSADLGAPEIPPPAKALRGFLRAIDPAGARFGDSSTMLYGPVCIDRAYRGHGILRGLVERLRALDDERFTIAVAFVSSSNPKSIAVHRDGMGMTVLGEFPFAGESLVALSFPLRFDGANRE